MEEKKVKDQVRHRTTIAVPQVAIISDTPTAPRKRSNRVKNKTLLYLANVYAKIWFFSEKPESGFVHYKYVRIFLCNIQIVLEYHSLKWRHQIVGGDD